MEGPHYRKVELQSPADLSYLHVNTVSFAREKLDLHFPPSANNDSESDPMKERVRDLVDGFINKTFSSAIPSVSLNGIDTSNFNPSKDPAENKAQLEALLSTRESIEYEPYDSALASRLTSLYAQLESLTTTVAQMRRDAPSKAARGYADALRVALEEDDEEEDDDTYDLHDDDDHENKKNQKDINGNNEDKDKDKNNEDEEMQDIKQTPSESPLKQNDPNWFRNLRRKHPDWILDVPSGTSQEQERWREGEMGAVYSKTLETLFHLQGDASAFDSEDDNDNGNGNDNNNDGDAWGRKSTALATTVGKVERARRAMEVIEKP